MDVKIECQSEVMVIFKYETLKNVHIFYYIYLCEYFSLLLTSSWTVYHNMLSFHIHKELQESKTNKIMERKWYKNISRDSNAKYMILQKPTSLIIISFFQYNLYQIPVILKTHMICIKHYSHIHFNLLINRNRVQNSVGIYIAYKLMFVS